MFKNILQAIRDVLFGTSKILLGDNLTFASPFLSPILLIIANLGKVIHNLPISCVQSGLIVLFLVNTTLFEIYRLAFSQE